MKEQINRLISKPEKIWPFAIVITGLMLSASITFASFSLGTKREVLVEKPIQTQEVLGLEATASAVLAPSPSAQPSPSVLKIIPTPKPSVQPSVVPTSTPAGSSQQTNSSSQSTPVIIHIIATPVPSPFLSPSPSPSPSSEPSPSPIAQKVVIEIRQPDAQINFELEITEGINVCQVMEKAKEAEKINSLTISDKYLESFGTLLVEEINGFRNNWVFTVNGESPNGCSLITLKNGDKVAWEFLNL